MTDNTPHILIIDDDEQICDLLQAYLKNQEWCVSSAHNTKEAEIVLGTFKPDIIILDVMMPEETGLQFLTRYRPTSAVPVLMLTAASDLDDKVAGLLAGADDYLAKPFEPEELLLRIKAILRRTKPESIAPSNIKIGTMEFDLERGILKQQDTILKLTEGESALLNILATNPGQTFSREELARRSKIEGDDRAVDVQITRLRKKMEIDPKTPVYVQTVRGKGYTLRV